MEFAITSFCEKYVDKFNGFYEMLCIDYFHKLAEINYQSVTGRYKTRLGDVAKRLYKYFMDQDKMKSNLIALANSKVPPGKYVMMNLWLELGIGQRVEGYGHTG